MRTSKTVDGNGAYKLVAIIEQPGDEIIGYEIWSSGVRLAGPFANRAAADGVFRQYRQDDDDSEVDDDEHVERP